MGILAWVFLGGLAGWIASMVIKTNANQGMVGNIIIGIIGAFIGGFVFNFFGGAGITGFNLYSLLVAIVGAVVLLYLARLFRG